MVWMVDSLSSGGVESQVKVTTLEAEESGCYSCPSIRLDITTVP